MSTARRPASGPETSCTSPPRSLCAGLAAVVLVVCGVWAPPPAAAHDALASSDPAEAGLVEALPSRAVLTFTGPVSEVHEVSVMGPDGSVANGSPTVSGTEVRQNLWAGPDGAYVLTYDVVSSDGHEVAGEVHFEVGPIATSGGPGAAPGGSLPASEEAAPARSTGDRVRSLLLPGAVVLAAGGVAFAVVRRRTQRGRGLPG